MQALDALDRFLDTVVEPLEAEHGELLADPRSRYRPDGILSAPVLELKRQVRVDAAAAGVYGLMVPTELGGSGLDLADQYAVWRHLYTRCGPDRLLPFDAVGTFTSGPGAALARLSSLARERVFPAVLSGEEVLCFAMSERTGSDHADVRTTAIPAGDGFVLRGEKTWVSRGGYADHALVYAVVPGTEPESSRQPHPTTAFLVPLSAPGARVVGANLLLGRVGGEEVTLAFHDVSLERWQLVGEVGGGGTVAESGVASSTAFTAGRFVGLARWALQHVTGRLADDADPPDPSARRLIAEAASEVEAVDLLAREYTARAGSGESNGRVQAILRLAAPEMCGRVYERVMQVEGGEALTNRARLFDGWHQSRIVQVAQATLTDALHEAIARDVLTVSDHRPQ